MLESYSVSLMDCENVLLREIAEPKATQKSLAITYAMAICSIEANCIDWLKVNLAIRARWPKGLERVKNAAHKLIQQKRKEQSS